jgi:hypothetical protein
MQQFKKKKKKKKKKEEKKRGDRLPLKAFGVSQTPIQD